MVHRQDYRRREQAYVKHYVLEHYLQQLALKIGHYRPGTTLNYIDGFSGPWQQATEALRDTSPHVALTQLCAARDLLRARQIELRVRGMFVETGREAFALLQGLLDEQFASVESAAHNGEFEAHIQQACRFAEQGPQPFAFVFIDPTGWTGYGLKAITPLLKIRRSEVLINFMTKDITRFVDDGESVALQSFIDLFGDATYREAWRGLADLDREDRIVETYCDRVLRAGGFAHCVPTVVLNPRHDRTCYHLVYATRSLHGLVAFRDTEREVTPEQRAARAEAKQRERLQRGQTEMFEAPVMETSYMAELQQRYHRRARAALADRLRDAGEVEFPTLVGDGLRLPMTCLADVKDWLNAWRDAGEVEFLGLAPGERARAIDKKHRVRWRGGRLS
ncbi:three-Cys-motif partner protein TcmP [Nannocystis bainbridge]|uniref:Three-Cys-motif partner protein TcmP n=1 Tax=Nannocystis bainbridge TaxID=2995303 RepID=A0ABT5DY29_9BACT|nr:three-Cys-motif partner protein TcmP [Nannocystis bainbridge]MDC0717346.1 three-Cys-motif partner protein TcmP [Nannocystis bainbridge]